MEVARYTEHFQHLKLSVKWVKGNQQSLFFRGIKKSTTLMREEKRQTTVKDPDF